MKDRSIALLADAYISPMFLNTLIRDGIPAFAQGERLEDEFKKYCPGLKILDKANASEIIAKHDSRILTNAESLLPCTIKHGDPSKAEGTKIFNDKLRFRQLLSKSFPDYFFAEALADKLKETDLPPGKDYVIKPSLGLSGIGLRRIKDGADLKKKADELLSEVGRSADSLGPDLLSRDRFLIEEYIRGEEIACDAFFNSLGEPVILGIYAHPLLNEDDFRDILYYTSAALVDRMLPRVGDFLRRLSSQMEIRNYPLHAEFRLKGNRLMPIEINPMRFGSFSLPELTFFAFGLNPYKYYYLDQKPDWNRALSQAEDKIIFRVLSRLEAPYRENKKPDHEEFASAFENLIAYCKLDLTRYPAFSIAFGQAGNVQELQKYLDTDFREYLTA